MLGMRFGDIRNTCPKYESRLECTWLTTSRLISRSFLMSTFLRRSHLYWFPLYVSGLPSRKQVTPGQSLRSSSKSQHCTSNTDRTSALCNLVLVSNHMSLDLQITARLLATPVARPIRLSTSALESAASSLPGTQTPCSGIARAPPATRRGGGLKWPARGPPGSSRLNLLARGPNKLFAEWPENCRYATDSLARLRGAPSIVDVQSCSIGEMHWTFVFAVLMVRPNLEFLACALSISVCRSSADSENKLTILHRLLLTMLPKATTPQFPSSSSLAITISRKMQNRSGDNTQPCKTPTTVWNQSLKLLSTLILCWMSLHRVLAIIEWSSVRIPDAPSHATSPPSIHCQTPSWSPHSSYRVIWRTSLQGVVTRTAGWWCSVRV